VAIHPGIPDRDRLEPAISYLWNTQAAGAEMMKKTLLHKKTTMLSGLALKLKQEQ